MAEYDGELAQVLDQVVTAETIGLVVALLGGIGGDQDLVKVKERSTERIAWPRGEIR